MRNPFLGGFGIGVILTSTPAIQICSFWTDHPADWGTCISHFCHETGSAGVGAEWEGVVVYENQLSISQPSGKEMMHLVLETRNAEGLNDESLSFR